MTQPLLFDSKFSPKPGVTCPEHHRRFLGKCPKKGCTFCKAADVPTKIEQRQQPFPFGAQFWAYDQRQAFERSRNYTVRTPEKARLPEIKCPSHGLHVTWTQIEGRVSEVHKCDPRCTGARGVNCECQCGGANHGADWL